MNRRYPKWNEALQQGEAALTGDVRALLVSSGYEFSEDHEFLADVPVDSLIAVSEPLEAKDFEDGVFDADDAKFRRVIGPNLINAILLFVDEGDMMTSRLVDYFDSAVGLPMRPDGTDVVIRWNVNGIHAL